LADRGRSEAASQCWNISKKNDFAERICVGQPLAHAAAQLLWAALEFPRQVAAHLLVLDDPLVIDEVAAFCLCSGVCTG
jgi:hypothetical protein